MKRILEYAVDLLYRERDICFMCGYMGAEVEKHICGECKDKLYFVGMSRCCKCGKATSYMENRKLYLCRDCEKHPKHFERGVSPLMYEGITKKLIHDFKYHDQLHLKKLFGELLTDELLDAGMESADMVLGVPLSRKRENKRGYNQAELISSYVGRKLGIRNGKGMLIRTNDTEVQKELGKLQRAKNLKSVFEVSSPKEIMEKTVLIIDDIYTTGATVDECAKTLLACGAKSVNIATVATSVERVEEE